MPLVHQSVIDPDVVEGTFKIVVDLFFLFVFFINGLNVFRFFIGLKLVLKWSYKFNAYWIRLLVLVRVNINAYLRISVLLALLGLLCLLFRLRWSLLLLSYADLRLVELALTTDNDHITVFVYGTRMTSAGTGFAQRSQCTLWCLRLNLGPLGDVYSLSSLWVCFIEDLTAVQVVKNDVAVSLAPKDVDLVVYQYSRMTISTLWNGPSFQAFMPTQLLGPWSGPDWIICWLLFLDAILPSLTAKGYHCVDCVTINIEERGLQVLWVWEDPIHWFHAPVPSWKVRRYWSRVRLVEVYVITWDICCKDWAQLRAVYKLWDAVQDVGIVERGFVLVHSTVHKHFIFPNKPSNMPLPRSWHISVGLEFVPLLLT